MKAELFYQANAALAEGPVWHDGKLLWVDISLGAVHVTDMSGNDDEHPLDGAVGFAVYRDCGGLVVGHQRGLFLYDLETRALTEYHAVPEMTSDLRFNDGKCDPCGRLYGGTMGRSKMSPTGQLYRITPQGVASVSQNLLVSNGLGWSPDGSVMYHIDSQAHCVWHFPYDLATGAMGERGILSPITRGVPDGMCVDADGGLWVAVWDGGRVEHISPDGRLISVIELPVSRASSCCFGGDDLRTLFITTARLDDEPSSGSIFCCVPGPAGLPSAVYRS